MFAASFSSAFAGVAPAYVGPMRAQQLLTDGAAWVASGSGLLVAGKRLIGPAGKTFEFASPGTAARWAANAKAVGLRERALMAEIEPATAAAWKARKREKLAVIAGRLVDAAAKQADEAKRAALVEEAGYCLVKWGV